MKTMNLCKLGFLSTIGVVFLTTIFLLIAWSSAQAVQPQVAAGAGYTVGLKSDGTLLAVGYNGDGRLNVGSWTNIVQVAAGGGHTVGLKSDGAVVAVGNNDYGQCNTSGWNLVVPNNPPVLDPIGNKQINEGQLLQFTITASDPDGDTLSYEASSLPTGATFNPVNQEFSWTPTYDQGARSHPNIEFTMTDNGSPSELDVEVIEIMVGNTNRAPVFSPVGSQWIPENHLLQFYVTATDPDGDAITYSTGPLPKGAFFDASGGLFSWTPDSTQAGTYTVTFYAMDSGSPPMTGNLNVIVNVGDVYTPCELADQIIQIVISLNLPKSVENSYMANLKKVCKFVEDGKMIQAIVQLDVFIAKVVIDVVKHDISEAAGRSLINMAVNLIKIIKS